jgi:hypothetical protein
MVKEKNNEKGGIGDMKREKFSCPICGSPHNWPEPLPALFRCCRCKSEFSPVEELRRYTVHICRPGQSDSFLETYYSGRPFIIPRRGDRILQETFDLSNDESLRVSDIDFEFTRVDNSSTIRQSVYVRTEISKEA